MHRDRGSSAPVLFTSTPVQAWQSRLGYCDRAVVFFFAYTRGVLVAATLKGFSSIVP